MKKNYNLFKPARQEKRKGKGKMSKEPPLSPKKTFHPQK
jgi:hypothetical protein